MEDWWPYPEPEFDGGLATVAWNLILLEHWRSQLGTRFWRTGRWTTCGPSLEPGFAGRLAALHWKRISQDDWRPCRRTWNLILLEDWRPTLEPRL